MRRYNHQLIDNMKNHCEPSTIDENASLYDGLPNTKERSSPTTCRWWSILLTSSFPFAPSLSTCGMI